MAPLWFSAEHKSVWKHNSEKTKPFIVIWESQEGRISPKKCFPLILTWPLPGLQPELECYWVTCKIVIIISQKLQWKHTSSFGKFFSVFSSNKISLSALPENTEVVLKLWCMQESPREYIRSTDPQHHLHHIQCFLIHESKGVRHLCCNTDSSFGKIKYQTSLF